ncbi:MAG TPA: tail fiber protein [Pyrinomonadaceae bacterium]|jgi:microcystin-dependent protein
MSNPFIGEIRMFGGNFAPAGWAFCDGQLIPISENDALFTLIGTTYGGDGQETFALPDLRGRIPLHQGQGPGISSNYILGERAGVEEVTLTINQIPIHTHPLSASTGTGTQQTPQGAVSAQTTAQAYASLLEPVNMSSQSIGPTGGSQPHTNIQPYLSISFIISLFGLFPRPN